MIEKLVIKGELNALCDDSSENLAIWDGKNEVFRLLSDICKKADLTDREVRITIEPLDESE
jgi:hypothetical protein